MYGKNTQGEVSIPICTCTPYVRSLWEWLHHEEQWGRAACWTCPWKEGQISSKLSWALIEGRPFGLQQMHIPAGHKKKKEKRKKEKKNPDFRTYEKKLNINNKKNVPGRSLANLWWASSTGYGGLFRTYRSPNSQESPVLSPDLGKYLRHVTD